MITWAESVMEESWTGTVSGKLEATRRKNQSEVGKAHGRDLTAINGRREELEGKIQQRYGLAKDEVRKEIDNWFASQGF